MCDLSPWSPQLLHAIMIRHQQDNMFLLVT